MFLGMALDLAVRLKDEDVLVCFFRILKTPILL